MRNFTLNISTKVLFGKGMVKNLPKELSTYGSNILLVYGGGSIKKNEVYQILMELLSEYDVSELAGVTPNPRIEDVRKGVRLARKNNVQVILAVGGGSVIDAAKLIAAGYYYDDDSWDLVLCPGEIKKALPIITVVTCAGTGSEMNGSAVITNEEIEEKLGATSVYMQPKVSILDPVYTYTVPAELTAAGVADTMSHIIESYFTKDEDTFIQNHMAEIMLKACIKYGPIAIEQSDNYEARANLLWASSLGLNGILGAGKATAWSCHPLEHELSACYDITHGVGMAILLPKWMEYVLNDTTVAKFAEYARNVFDISEGDEYEMARNAINMTAEFFRKLRLPASLQEVGINDEKFEIMAKRAVTNGMLAFAYEPLKLEDVVKIYEMCLF